MDPARLREMLEDAAQGAGAFGIGSASEEEAEALGYAWVGEGHTTARAGGILISKDGLRQYRPPAYKPKLGKRQANLERRERPGGKWTSNAHIDVAP